MKVTQQKARQPMIRFLHSQLKENGIVHEWSMARNPVYQVNQKEVQNPNVKVYHHKPDISITN